MTPEDIRRTLHSGTTDARRQVVAAMAQSGNQALVGALIAHFRVEREPVVRADVVSALSRLIPPDRLGALSELASDASPAVRLKVLEVLFGRGCEAVFALAVRSLSDSDPDVKAMSLKVLGRLGAKNLIKLLTRMLGHEQVHWRLYALAAVGQFKNDHMVPLLETALRDPIGQIRLQARASLLSLAQLGSQPAREALARLDGGPVARPGWTEPPGNKTLIVEPPPPSINTTRIEVTPPIARPTAETPARRPPARADDNTTVVMSAQELMSRSGNADGEPAATVPIAASGVATEGDAPRKKRMSTGVYKALFGESRPRMQRPKLDPGEVEKDSVEEPEIAAAQAEPADDGRKKPNWEQNVCRDCGYANKRRPDGQKMAPMRLWCNIFKKETSVTKTCPRGKWPS